MSKKNKIFIPCEEANHVCDKSQYKEASLWEMIKLNLHLLYCNACRKYTKNNTKLTNLFKVFKNEQQNEDPKVINLDNERKDAMKKDFEKALKKHSL